MSEQHSASAQDGSSPTPPTGDSQPKPESSYPRRIEQAIVNTLYRSSGEIAGRLASLVMFAVAGRILGAEGLGAFVFAVAVLSFAIVPVDLGLDRHLLRLVAQERSSADSLFFNVVTLKIAVAVPLFALTLIGLRALGYSHEILATTLALAPGVLCDSLARTQQSLFMAHERGAPPSFADGAQRILSAALGIVALKAGYGVVAVAVTYSLGSLTGVVINFYLLPRTIGTPTRSVSTSSWRGLITRSIPFASQEVFATLLARVDILILSLIATQAAVGSYGAAYRLFESTLLITWALVGAFSAMFAYLHSDSEPSLRTVFQQSVKLSLVLLTPIAATFLVLSGPICRLVYGTSFSAAATPLAILGPAVVLLGLVTLTTSLIVSRENPGLMVPVTAAAAALNIGLNLALIPAYGASGAAGAMLATEVVFAGWILWMAARTVGGVRWLPTAAGAMVGGAAMIVLTLGLQDSPLAAASAGTLTYILVLVGVERLLSPEDVHVVREMLRRRPATKQAE